MEEQVEYNWRIRALAKGIDPEHANKELQRIKSVYGVLTAEVLVQEAKPPSSVFHPVFQWDDTKAAHNYRLQQARSVINNLEVTIIRSGNEVVHVPVFEICKNSQDKKQSYKSYHEIIANPEDFQFVKEKAKRELVYWQKKYVAYEKLQDIVNQVTPIIASL